MTISLQSALCFALTTLVGVGGARVARADGEEDAGRVQLGICQRVLGEDASTCEARTAFSLTKVIDDDVLEQPNRQAVAYTIKLVEGQTRYVLGMTTLVTLTGLMPEGSQIRGIVASLQKKSAGDSGFTTVASALVGNADPHCGCPFVGSADLTVTMRDEAGTTVDPGVDNLIDDLAYGEDRVLQLDALYDLGQGIVLPGDEVRLQACVQWALIGEEDRQGCVDDGGATRAIRACNGFDFQSYATPEASIVDLSEALQRPKVEWAELNGFRAVSLSPNLTPTGTSIPILPGGAPTLFAVKATGMPGTESVVKVTGDVSCGQHVTCEGGGALCFADIINDAILSFHDDRAPLTATAKAQIYCKPLTCLPGDVAACDDGDPCTTDGCQAGVGCTHEPYFGECDDGNACTVGETCATGVCEGGGPLRCGEAAACVDAFCDPEFGCVATPKPNRTKCDDKNACTVDDECMDGQCKGGAPMDCNDGNVCTNDACSPTSGCTHAATTTPTQCDDGNVCTTGDTCSGGACSGPGAKGCDDNNPCTIDRCDPAVAGGCVHDPAPSTTACEDGNQCTVGDSCQAGVCKSGRPRVCGDGNQCTDDRCDAQLGCYFPPRTGTCDDGNACSTASACQSSTCTPTAMLDCDDGNPCTVDSCDPASGCKHAPATNGVGCDDGDPCTSGDSCQSGTCVPKTETVCDDGNQCTDSTCLPGQGCVHLPRSGSCEDGDRCTGPDMCDAGRCQSGASISCDDGNPCTTDACDKTKGCVHSLLDAGGCDDGDPCTAPGVCQAGVCKQQTPVSCDDKNSCTADSCVTGVGCQYLPVTGTCDDKDPCTLDGTCSAGICQKGPARVCDDGNECTYDFCRDGVGCQTLARTQVPCDDKNRCTSGDMCDSGVCVGGPPLDCDDHNPCTDDLCTATGCEHKQRTGACEDGDLCTVGDSCVSGVCVTGTQKSCDDGNSCTVDSCVSSTGSCKNQSLADGSSCEDGDSCTGCGFPETKLIAGWKCLDAVPDTTLLAAGTPTGVVDLLGFESGARVVMTAKNQVRFVQVSTTTAYLRGTVTANGVDWEIAMELTYRGEGPAGQGASPYKELPSGTQTQVWTDHWRYWMPKSGATLTRLGTTPETVALATEPSLSNLPLQMGWRANGRNLLYGASLPVRWTRAGKTGSGTIRVTLDREYCQKPDLCGGGVCAPGSSATECMDIVAGDYCTYSDADYGAPCPADQPNDIACRLAAAYAQIAVESPLCSSQKVYAFGFSTYRRYAFSTATAIVNFLPTTGVFSTAVVDLCNPGAASGNRFVSRAIALDLSVALSDAGVLPAPHGVPFGDLVLTAGSCAGFSIRDLVQRAEMLADGVTPPGTFCKDTTTVESVILSITSGFRMCAGVADGVGLPE